MHEFERRLGLAISNGNLTLGDSAEMVFDITISHDEDCSFFQKQECDCDPLVTIRAPNRPTRRILRDGTVLQCTT